MTTQFTIDLSTEQGKTIFAAVAAIVLGSTFKAEVSGAPATVKTPVIKAPATKAAETLPAAPNAAPTAPSAPALPSVPTPPVSAPIAPPSAPAAPTAPMTAPVAPTAPPAPSIAPPAAPSLPKAPAAPAKEPKAPKAPAAPAVPFEQLDEAGKREAIKKLTTKHSKKGKTADMKALFSAYGATNVETVDASYLDHLNWSITTYDGNGQDMAAVLATFGAQ